MNPVRKQYWWGSHSNFGDMIGQELVEHLLGCKLPLAKGGDSAVLLGPGSIIGCCDRFASSVVWGSGIDPHYSNVSLDLSKIVFLAVRGPKTRSFLNLDIPVLGDPGFLLPRIYPQTPSDGPISVVVHHSTCKRRLREFLFDPYRTKYRIIDPRRDWRAVVNEICQSKFVFCQSLHGAIVAEAYGVPWAWWKGFHGRVAGFKWEDWFASISVAPKAFGLRDLSGAMRWRAHTKTRLPDLNALAQVLIENVAVSAPSD